MVSTFISTSSAIWIDGIITYVINVLPPVQSSCLKSLTLEMNRYDKLGTQVVLQRAASNTFRQMPGGPFDWCPWSPEFVCKFSTSQLGRSAAAALFSGWSGRPRALALGLSLTLVWLLFVIIDHAQWRCLENETVGHGNVYLRVCLRTAMRSVMYYLCILYIVYVYLYRIHVQDINQYNMIGNVGVSCGQWPVYKARPVAGGPLPVWLAW